MNESRIVSPGRGDEDTQYEAGLRPRTLDDYIGQDRVRENLHVSIKAANQRGEALDHVLLYGPPGLGKTTLASVIAVTHHAREGWFILLLTLLSAAGIYLGIAWESPVFLNTSLVFFAVNLYTRFYEYFWDAMPKSLFFIVGGAALILGGVWVERMRRRVVRQFATAAA